MSAINFDLKTAVWRNAPSQFELSETQVSLTTAPKTDLWQRTHYGFQGDNAPMLLTDVVGDFSFTVRCQYRYEAQYDQCGVVLYLDSDNWFKGSLEFETRDLSRLGSVTTNLGYSDWASMMVPTTALMSYRLSRRGADFLLESSANGAVFRQLRIFHMHKLRDLPSTQPVSVGLYACSPKESSFTATFDRILLEECLWDAYS